MTSPVDARPCGWCKVELSPTQQRWCSKRCRQTAFRLRRRRETVRGAGGPPCRIAYADPPYPGMSARFYKNEPSFAGEVDHAALIRDLMTYDGWALSTSARALRDVLPLCPKGARVCPWVKPHGAAVATNGIHNCWEPLIVVPARHVPPGKRDWLSALPARGGGELPGRKPLAFCAWLFSLLGAEPAHDVFYDLFPGSGIVSAAWLELHAEARRERATSPTAGAERRPDALEVDFDAYVEELGAFTPFEPFEPFEPFSAGFSQEGEGDT